MDRTRRPTILRGWRSALVLVLAAWLGPPAAARAETANCTEIAVLPTVITVPGHYCLAKDFAQAFTGTQVPVRISADDVVLDCNDHAIRDTTADYGQAAIHVGDSRQGVTVRNCTVEGFYLGIHVTGYEPATSRGNTLENNVILRSHYEGIDVSGSNNRIVGNRVDGVLGDVTGNPSGITLFSFGADSGVGNVVLGNTITNIRNTTADFSYSVGITVYAVRETVIADNIISGLYNVGSDYTIGIYGNDLRNLVIRDNTILTVPGGNSNDWTAAYLITDDAAADGILCRDNVVGHWEPSFIGCVSIGNTEF
jgi:parallel beta-helix repeat protein